MKNQPPGISSLDRTKDAEYWETRRKKQALKLFKQVSRKVPAYAGFLKKNRINPQSVKSYDDFLDLPPISKKNYLKQYALEEITRDGDLLKPLVYTSTSGSTGVPSYFHRSFDLDQRASITHELFLNQRPEAIKEPTLVIVCFGMGVWIGGLITYQSFRSMQERGYNISIITPGINKEEIFKALISVASSYKNLILVGYPPFIKDIIDEGPSRGINWRKFRTRLIFAAEPFTENFRDYCTKNASVVDPLLDTMNIYGSAELGAMSFETPLCILIRRLCAKNQKLFKGLFGEIAKTPTLTQYIPDSISFNSKNGDIFVTSDNTIPLINYAIGDHGGTYTFQDMEDRLKEFDIDIRAEAKKAKIDRYLYELPFVFVYERDDMSTTLYGLQIYPEHIREPLLKKPISDYLTSKFVLETKFDKEENQFLQINLELKEDKILPPVMRKLVLSSIVENIEQKNAEFRELRKHLGKRALPKLIFWPLGDPQHFKVGVKQKWVKK